MKRKGTLSRKLGMTMILAGALTIGMGISAQAAPAQVQITSGTASESAVTLKWSKAKKAVSYNIYVKKGKGKAKLLANRSASKDNAVKIKNLKNNTSYTFFVSAVDSEGKEGKKSAGKVLKPTVIRPSQAINIMLSDLSNNSVTVSWDKAALANYYSIEKKQPDGSFKRIAKTKKTKVVLKGLSQGTEYQIGVRSMRRKGGASAAGYLSKVVRFTPGPVAGALANVATYQRYASSDYHTDPTIVYPSNVAEAFANTRIPAVSKVNYASHYLIWISAYTQHFYIFYRKDTSKWEWKLKKVFICASGKGDGTRYGWMFIRGAKKSPVYFTNDKDQIGYYPSYIDTGFIHSQLYHQDGSLWTSADLGHAVSHGCIRLRKEAAKWINEKIPAGTRIWVN